MAWSNIGGGGGENVKPEVDIQTALIEDIKESLVGKATGANATEDTILEGYSAYVGQELVVGKYKPHGLYVWKKYEYDSESSAVGDFIEYVISDASDTYPDGGAQDGYWYEKNKDILTAEKLGYTKIAVDTFTLTSNASGTKTVSHSLGDLPKFLFLLSDDTTDGYIRVYFCSYYGNEAMNIKYYNNNGSVVIYDASSISNPTWNSTQLQIFATASTKLRAGQEYTLITMA